MRKTMDVYFCDFCGQSHFEVKDMISGVEAAICSDCVALCVEILEEKQAKEPAHA